jgi:hypothetical protein
MAKPMTACARAARAVAAIVALLLLRACSADDERPPPLTFSGAGIDAFAVCGELGESVPDAGQLLLDAAPAGCVAEGLMCPLPNDLLACTPKLSYAECKARLWRPICVERPDASAADGG